jgi:hypothetical protein
MSPKALLYTSACGYQITCAGDPVSTTRPCHACGGSVGGCVDKSQNDILVRSSVIERPTLIASLG